ncbi:uncharacterized protein BYT42DRAFT_552501 [Radiomyces spectabilis]|uniref:uncharacterized protein n=1 Tax=Radiomyces spectabilis TaxID=64574 RepID=UPI00222097C1|nr:uncharacterized protein BYT42DRAFT_552501 [Radiomyces spectabilis]KAI8393867.1 hypothetical protein BYT42DRAFT_552501 [Radiomyces spectabilis]
MSNKVVSLFSRGIIPAARGNALLMTKPTVRHVHRGVFDVRRLRMTRYPSATARPLLNAIMKYDQEGVWNAYINLNDRDELAELSAEYHSSALRSFRIKNLLSYGPEEVATLKERLAFVLASMKSLNQHLDDRDYAHLLGFYGRIGDWSSCQQLWKDLSSQLRPSRHCYNAYIRAAIQCDQPGEIFAILNSMKATGVPPNAFTYNMLIEAQGRLGNLKEADAVFVEAFRNPVNAGQEPGIKDASQLSYALRLSPVRRFAQKASNIPRPSVATFSSLIDAHGRQGNLQGINHIYKTMMPKYGVTPNLDIYNGLIRWYCIHEDAEAARQAFADMEKASIKPNLITFNHIFRLEALKRRRPKTAETLMNFMKQVYQLAPLDSMYRTLIRIHHRHRRENEAKRLFDEYAALKSDPK